MPNAATSSLDEARYSGKLTAMKAINGFTLPELLIVMVIVSMLSLGAVTGWVSWQQRQQLDEHARQVQHFLLRLRGEANWFNQQRLLWHRQSGVWCIGSGEEQASCENDRRDVLRSSHESVVLQSLTDGMGFYGRRNMAKAGRIVIANAAGQRHIIVSSRGRVRVCKESCQ